MQWIILLLIGVTVFIFVFAYQHFFFSKYKVAKRLLALFVLVILVMIAAYIRIQTTDSKIEQTILNPIAAPIDESLKAIDSINNSSVLEKIVREELKNSKGTYAIAIKNLKTNEQYLLNEDMSFDSASLYKLWIMGTAFEQFESEKLKPEQKVEKSVEDINKTFELEGDSKEFTQGSISFSIIEGLEKMITVSDNYSAHLITLTVKFSNIIAFLKRYELDNSSIESPPKTTAADTLLFFEKLYNGKIVSRGASDKMIEILKRQKLNDRIPKYLPGGTVVAHKTGELDRFKHDAGIVFGKSGDYIIVLLSETPSQATAAEIEARISEKVWNYFN